MIKKIAIAGAAGALLLGTVAIAQTGSSNSMSADGNMTGTMGSSSSGQMGSSSPGQMGSTPSGQGSTSMSGGTTTTPSDSMGTTGSAGQYGSDAAQGGMDAGSMSDDMAQAGERG